jgi:hypothetical protein
MQQTFLTPTPNQNVFKNLDLNKLSKTLRKNPKNSGWAKKPTRKMAGKFQNRLPAKTTRSSKSRIIFRSGHFCSEKRSSTMIVCGRRLFFKAQRT